jgi:uncharacterized protein (TIGR04255 family)
MSVGRLYERIRSRFPTIEELPAAAVPEQMTPHIVRQRFRASPGGWPCVQLGPGVMTVNFTNEYSWTSFRENALWLLPQLEQAYEGVGAVSPEFVLLRYINVLPFNVSSTDVLSFLSDKLHVTLTLPDAIARYSARAGLPDGLIARVGLPLNRPRGTGAIQVASGARDNEPSLVWEQSISSNAPHAPSIAVIGQSWLDEAHAVIEDWFFALIGGELETSFMEPQ